MDDAGADQVRAALVHHQLLVFEGQQHLDPADEVRFYLKVDIDADSVWRDQVNNPWEVFKIQQGNVAGTYQLPGEPGVLVLGKGEIDHFGLKVTLGGDRAAYGGDSGSQVLGGGALQWHIDGTFYQNEPCNLTQMRCIEPPSGSGHWLGYNDGTADRLWCEAGSTVFASGRVAYNCLDAKDRVSALDANVHYLPNPFQASYGLANNSNGLRVEDPDAEVLYHCGQEKPGRPSTDPDARVHPLVWLCPKTGVQAVMPHTRCMSHLELASRGVHMGKVASRRLVEKWMRPAIDPDAVYVHNWKAGDLVIWDNRSMWHSATGKLSRDDRRIQHLTAYNGHTPPG